MHFPLLVICFIVYGRVTTLELRNQPIFYVKLNTTKKPVYVSNTNVTFI